MVSWNDQCWFSKKHLCPALQANDVQQILHIWQLFVIFILLHAYATELCVLRWTFPNEDTLWCLSWNSVPPPPSQLEKTKHSFFQKTKVLLNFGPSPLLGVCSTHPHPLRPTYNPSPLQRRLHGWGSWQWHITGSMFTGDQVKFVPKSYNSFNASCVHELKTLQGKK